LDALIFTGGIGENAALVRHKVLVWLSIFDFEEDPEANAAAVGGKNGVITKEDSNVALVIHTNEEIMIVNETIEVLNQ
jgi:acetate kinase